MISRDSKIRKMCLIGKGKFEGLGRVGKGRDKDGSLRDFFIFIADAGKESYRTNPSRVDQLMTSGDVEFYQPPPNFDFCTIISHCPISECKQEPGVIQWYETLPLTLQGQ